MGQRAGDPAGRTDLWKPKFTQLVIVPRLNIRTDYGDLSDLDSIATQGVKQPFRGWREKGKYYVVDGHRRYEKLAQLYKKDKIDREVPFLLEPQNTQPKQRIIDMFVLGTGKGLTPLEQAEGVLRLLAEGMSEAEIARELGKSNAYINRLSEFGKATPEIKEAVANNTISATTAVDLIIDNQQDQFIKDLKDGKYDRPGSADLFNTGGSPTSQTAAGGRKMATIKAKEVQNVTNKKKDEVKDTTVNSWSLVKSFIGNYEGKPEDPTAQKLFLFLGKVIANKITEANLKTMFKK